MRQHKGALASLLFLLSLPALAQRDATTARGDGRPPGPPPEAYAACAGKSAGDTASLTLRDGRAVQGTCDWSGDRLAVLMPPPGAQGATLRGGDGPGPMSGDAGVSAAPEPR